MKYNIGDKRIRVQIEEKIEHGSSRLHTLVLRKRGRLGNHAKWRTLENMTVEGDSVVGKKILELIGI